MEVWQEGRGKEDHKEAARRGEGERGERGPLSLSTHPTSFSFLGLK
jgi:hypothetical protein